MHQEIVALSPQPRRLLTPPPPPHPYARCARRRSSSWTWTAAAASASTSWATRCGALASTRTRASCWRRQTPTRWVGGWWAPACVRLCVSLRESVPEVLPVPHCPCPPPSPPARHLAAHPSHRIAPPCHTPPPRRPSPRSLQDGLIDYAEFSWLLRNQNDELRNSGRAGSKGQLAKYI